LIVNAFRLTSVGTLAPLQYVKIIGATFLGYAFFDDFPDTLTWLNISITISSGIYVFRREALLAQEEKVKVETVIEPYQPFLIMKIKKNRL